MRSFKAKFLLYGEQIVEKRISFKIKLLMIFFGKLVQTKWIPKISFTSKREAEIQSCFDCAVKFHYPKDKN